MNKARIRTNRRLARFESLETRQMLTSFGVPWPEATDLTLSFAPDGTQIGSQTSELFNSLDGQAPTRAWQEDVLRAFQTWAVNSNINVGLVADGGQPLGSLGLKQGDPRFGDVRIGAFPMANDVLAVSDPYDPFVANTWVGDVFLNSRVDFSAKAQNAGYDLYSVLLHEAGHVFGLDHSTDPSSPMFDRFHTAEESSLTAADVSRLQSLYGARSPDTFDAAGSNGTLASATPLSIVTADGRASPITAEGDITTLNDIDVYRIVVPEGVQSLDVRLAASSVSLLISRMTILNSAGDRIVADTARNPLQNNVHLAVNSVKPGEIYYVKVESGRNDVFGIGSYHLQITPHGSGASGESTSVGGSSYATNGATLTGSGSSSGPIELTTTPGYVEHTYYEVDSALSDSVISQTFRVRSADLGEGITNVMTVVLAADDVSAGLQVSILDDNDRPVPANVIYNVNGQIELQVPSVVSDRDYLVQVTGGRAGAVARDYELTVDFDADGAHLETYVNDSISANQPEVIRTLNVLQSQQFHFVLSASDWNHAAQSGLEMRIFNAVGQQMFDLAVADGSTRTQDVFLDAGQYSVRFRSPQHTGDGIVTFELNGMTMSEPIGPQLRDTTLEPVEAPVEGALSALSFYWLPGGVARTSVSPDQSVFVEPTEGIVDSASAATGSPAVLLPPVSFRISTSDQVFDNFTSPTFPVLVPTGSTRAAKRPTTNDDIMPGIETRNSNRANSSRIEKRTPSTSQPPPVQLHSSNRVITCEERWLTVPEARRTPAAQTPSADTVRSTIDSQAAKQIPISSQIGLSTSPPDAKIDGYFVAFIALIAACLSLPASNKSSWSNLLNILKPLNTIRSLFSLARVQRQNRLKHRSNVGMSGDWSARELA